MASQKGHVDFHEKFALSVFVPFRKSSFPLQPNFKDYPVYLLKFKQCLSKALHLMKTYTVNTLQNLTNQLLKRVS